MILKIWLSPALLSVLIESWRMSPDFSPTKTIDKEESEKISNNQNRILERVRSQETSHIGFCIWNDLANPKIELNLVPNLL
jgi:hypothetical protein